MITEPQDPNHREPSQIKQTSFFKRHRIIIIILMSVVSLLIITAVAVLIVLDTAFVAVRDGCTEKDNRLQTTVSLLEKRLRSISINGSSPSEVKSWKNGDCLTGSGAVGTASFFKLPYSNIAEANGEVVKSLHATPQDSKPFILGDDNGDGLVEFIQTKLIDSVHHETYEVKYYLIDKITCPDHEYNSATCIHGETPEDMDGYMGKPINKIELSLRMATN